MVKIYPDLITGFNQQNLLESARRIDQDGFAIRGNSQAHVDYTGKYHEGHNPAYQNTPFGRIWQEQSYAHLGVDKDSWNADFKKQRNDFADRVNKITEAARTQMKEDPVVQELLQKNHWERPDREVWEAALTDKIINAENKDDLLGGDTYRVKASENLNLNELTKDSRYDCVPMSIVAAHIAQKIEDSMLPEADGDPKEWKQAGQYFTATGMLSWKKQNEPIEGGGHGFVVTPAGNVIDAANPSYQKSIHPDASIEQAAAGFPIVTMLTIEKPGDVNNQHHFKDKGGASVYTVGYGVDDESKASAARRLELMQKNDWVGAASLSSQRHIVVGLGEMDKAINALRDAKCVVSDDGTVHDAQCLTAITSIPAKAPDPAKGK